MERLCLSNATDHFKQIGLACQTPRSVSSKAALNLSWDLGAAIGVGGYFNEGTEFYTSIGPGVTFGRQSGGVRGDFSIRFQHMGEGLNAILFRIGIGF